MACKTHSEHTHKHGADCGHPSVQHEDHTDYLHDGHLHHVHEDHVDEHAVSESTGNASKCTPDHTCDSHEKDHKHSSSCGHDSVPHGDHVDYVVNGHLHSPCGDHCDHHGPLVATKK